jgi:hypothetical protein
MKEQMGIITEDRYLFAGEEKRGRNKFRFDRSINFGNLLSVLIILYGLYMGFESIKKEFKTVTVQNQIMWKHFIENNQLTMEELRLLNER